MPIFNKPEFNNVWAANGVKVAPEDAKIAQGWVVEIPPYQYANWLEHRRDVMLAHLNQHGIPSWDATTEYHARKSYVQGRDSGRIYRALTTHKGINPEVDVNRNWEVAFENAGAALLKSQNLADVPNKALARQNLGIATTADYDLRYLIKSSNLSDVPNKPTARANLDIYSKQEVINLINNMQPAGEVAAFARSTAPSGWLVCDGRAVSRTEFAKLFAAIGTTFGAGNGSTTFNIPDLRGEFIRGWDNGRGLDRSRGFGTLQESENKSHSHAGSAASGGEHGHDLLADRNDSWGHHARGGDAGHVGAGYRPRENVGANWIQPGGAHTHNLSISASGSNESRPRNVALLYCIRT